MGLSGDAEKEVRGVDFTKLPNGQIITLPCSSDLKVGLLRAAIKKAGLTVEDFQILIQ